MYVRIYIIGYTVLFINIKYVPENQIVSQLHLYTVSLDAF